MFTNDLGNEKRQENNKIQFEIKSRNLNRIKFSLVNFQTFGLTRLHASLAKYNFIFPFFKCQCLSSSFSTSYLDPIDNESLGKWSQPDKNRAEQHKFNLSLNNLMNLNCIISQSAWITMKFNFTTSNFHESFFKHTIMRY